MIKLDCRSKCVVEKRLYYKIKNQQNKVGKSKTDEGLGFPSYSWFFNLIIQPFLIVMSSSMSFWLTDANHIQFLFEDFLIEETNPLLKSGLALLFFCCQHILNIQMKLKELIIGIFCEIWTKYSVYKSYVGNVWSYIRLVLIEEKEQLLRELRSLNLKHRTKEDVIYIQTRIQELEQDLQREIDEANRQMAVKNIR